MNRSFHRVRPHLQPPYATNQAATVSVNPSPPAAPPTREDPPFQRQSEQAEREIQDLMNALEYLKRELGEILLAHMVTMNLVSNTNNYDLKKLLNVLLRDKRKNGARSTPLSRKQIEKLQKVRNNIDHHNWGAVQRQYQSQLNTMMALATSLNNTHFAGQIVAVENRVVVHKDFTGGVTFKPFTFPPNGAFDMDAGIGLSLITARAFNKIVIPCTSDFQTTYHPPGSPPPSVDLYANVGEMIDKKEADPTFLPQQGALRILKSVKATRLNVAHGDYETLLNDFEAKYDDLVDYLRMTKHPEDADTVQDVKDKLVEFKNSGEEVRSSEFPMLYSS